MNALALFSDALQQLVVEVSKPVLALTHRRGHGTGIVLSGDGFALTNAHVVDGVKSLRATASDFVEMEARVVGVDTQSDLAVLQLDRNRPATFPFAPEAEVAVGQLVVALGHPFGLERSVSLGVVSALDRTLPGRRGAALGGLLQTDAAINPGNSGGPLVDMRGRLVGINTAMLQRAQGIGFAISASVAAWIAPILIRHGVVRRRFLGVSGRNERAAESEHGGQASVHGVRILEVARNSPAAWGGYSVARRAHQGCGRAG